MAREERDLQKAFSEKEIYENLLGNLEALKSNGTVTDDQYSSMKTGYQKSQEQAMTSVMMIFGGLMELGKR